jgi:beta-phosphoglucomutase family hydrolase
MAFIFDVDGVIVDSNPVHLQVWREYLQRHGLAADWTLPERMYGLRNDEIVRDLIGGDLTPEETAAHGAAKEALYREVMRPQLPRRLVPGVVDFLRKHRAISMGVASNAEPANVDFILDEGGLRDYFSVVVDGHQVERPKPDPGIFLRTAELLKVPPERCVVFEDSWAGVRAAREAGARVVALRTTHTSFPGAHFEMDDFLCQDLESWIGRQAL